MSESEDSRSRRTARLAYVQLALVVLFVTSLANVLRADPGLARAAPTGSVTSGAAASKPADWSMLAGKEDGAAHPAAQSPTPAAAAVQVGAKAPAPPVPTAGGDFAKTAIHRDARESANSPADPAPSGNSNLSDVPRVVLALAVVIALILFLRWGGRRIFGLPGGGRTSHAVQVLSRSALTPRQQVVLLKVGRRVLVVADNGSQMNSLCQITDPDEVASLVGQLRSEKGGSPASASAGAFGGLFGGSRKKFDNSGDDDSSANAARPQSGTGTRKPVPARGPVRPADPPQAIIDPEDIGFDEAEAEAAVKVARQELMGLKEKLRMVSERFGMPEEGRKKQPRRSDGHSDRGPAVDGLFKDEAAETMNSLFKEEGAT